MPLQKDRPRVKMLPLPGGRHNSKSPCGHPQFYTTKPTEDFERHVGEKSLEQLRSVQVEGGGEFFLPLEQSRFILGLRFNFTKPKSYSKSVVHMVVKPDLDNLVKAILDALVKYAVIKDDNTITDLMVSKRYADEDHPEGIEVDLTSLAL